MRYQEIIEKFGTFEKLYSFTAKDGAFIGLGILHPSEENDLFKYLNDDSGTPFVVLKIDKKITQIPVEVMFYYLTKYLSTYDKEVNSKLMELIIKSAELIYHALKLTFEPQNKPEPILAYKGQITKEV